MYSHTLINMAPQISDSEEMTPTPSEEERSEDELDEELDEELDAMVDGNDDDEIPELSDDEDNYNVEDPDEIDEDLELKEEFDDEDTPVGKGVNYSGGNRNARGSRKRMNYYEEYKDEEFDSEQSPQPSKKVKVVKSERPEAMDPDLLLTDEETEYNPANHEARMTVRQRKLELEGFDDLDKYYGHKKSTKPRKQKVSEEEAAVRKAENARRRLDYKNKQLEEEKQDTLNKLLKRRATKLRDTEDDAEIKEDQKEYKPRRPIKSHPAFLRYTTNTTTLNGNATLAFNV